MKQRIKQLFNAPTVERRFLLIAIPFCLFFLFAIPALQGWDEATHFLRAYQVSQAQIIPEKLGPNSWGGTLPINVLQMNDAFITDLVASSETNLERSVHTGAYITYLKTGTPSPETTTRNFESSAVYSPVAYAAPSLGIAIARFFEAPLLSYIYVGRLFALALWILLMFFAIRRIPVGKWVLFVIALLPTTVTSAVSLSPDALIIGAASFLVAIFLDYYLKPRQLYKWDLLLIVGLVLVLALSKQTYALFALLFLLWPIRVFGNRLRYLLTNGGVIIVTLLIAGAWFAAVNPIVNDIHFTQRVGVNVDPEAQKEFILHEPIQYAAILGNAVFTNNLNPIYIQFAGHLTWKGILLPSWIILVSYLALIVAFFGIGNELKLRRLKPVEMDIWRRVGLGALIVVLVAAIYTSLYIAFSVLRSTRIEGVQGRYFISLVPLLIPFFALAKRTPTIFKSDFQFHKVLTVLSLITLSVASLTLITANYVPDLFG